MAKEQNVYVALFRGINVGGHSSVHMAKLKLTFERLGFNDVRTFIASGNVIFGAISDDITQLTKQIEAAIEVDFGLNVKVLLRSRNQIATLVKEIPTDWINDVDTKCDVMFLWSAIDSPKVLGQLPYNPDIEDVIYFPGAVIWRIDRKHASKSRMFNIAGTTLYQQVTVRNPNTVRKLYELMRQV